MSRYVAPVGLELHEDQDDLYNRTLPQKKNLNTCINDSNSLNAVYNLTSERRTPEDILHSDFEGQSRL